MKTTGGFIVYDLNSKRIIKAHNHYKTAYNQWKKLGREGYVIKPTADLEAFYAQLKAVDMVSTMFSQTY